MSDNEGKRTGLKRYYDAVDGFKLIGGSLSRLLLVGPTQGVEVRIKQRGEYDWIAIAKRINGDNVSEVTFGFGVGPIEAITALDNQINSGGWRVDKPFKPE